MLTLRELTLHNFVTYKDAVFKFDKYFKNDRLLLVTGKNFDDPTTYESNGSGKSLIYEAFCWALFDRTTRGGAKDSIIGEFDKGCHVIVNVVDLAIDREYEIVRYRKDDTYGNNVFFSIDGKRQEFSIKTDVDKFICVDVDIAICSVQVAPA